MSIWKSVAFFGRRFSGFAENGIPFRRKDETDNVN